MNRTSRRAAIQVGFTGLLATILLLAGIAFIKEYRLGQKKITFTARFQEVGNLQVGDPVSVRGVRKGAVTLVKLEPDGVHVEFKVDRDVVLRPDARLRVANIGFMGEKFLALDPGSVEGDYDASLPIPGRFQSGVPEVIAGAGDLIIEATELSSRLNVMLDALDPATMERATKNVEKATLSLSNTIQENETELKHAITDFRAAARQLNTIASTNAEGIEQSIKDFGTASRKLSELSDQLAGTAAMLERVVARVDSSEGSLGLAISDPSLFHEMKETLRNTNELVRDIKKNPKRYLKMSLF